MLDIFVGKALAARTLGQSDAFAQRLVVRFAVGRVKSLDGEAASWDELVEITRNG